MEWLVRLSGDVDTLQELSKSFISSELFIGKERDIFVLRTKDFKSLENDSEVFHEAARFISIINGGLKPLGFNRNIMVDQVIKEEDNGIWHYYVAVSIESTTSVGVNSKVNLKSANGYVEEINQTEPLLKWFLLARDSEDIAKIFRLLGKTNSEWPTNFYRIFEIIDGDIKDISQKEWVTSTAITRFRRTVQSPEIVGDIARHGTQEWEPPSNPMYFCEAKAFINTIVLNWLRSKVNVNPSTFKNSGA